MFDNMVKIAVYERTPPVQGFQRPEHWSEEENPQGFIDENAMNPGYEPQGYPKEWFNPPPKVQIPQAPQTPQTPQAPPKPPVVPPKTSGGGVKQKPFVGPPYEPPPKTTSAPMADPRDPRSAGVRPTLNASSDDAPVGNTSALDRFRTKYNPDLGRTSSFSSEVPEKDVTNYRNILAKNPQLMPVIAGDKGLIERAKAYGLSVQDLEKLRDEQMEIAIPTVLNKYRTAAVRTPMNQRIRDDIDMYIKNYINDIFTRAQDEDRSRHRREKERFYLTQFGRFGR